MAESNQRKFEVSNFGLDDSLRWGNRLFFRSFGPLAICLGCFSVIRLLFVIASPVFFASADSGDLMSAFLMGARFDLLILGYMMIPVVLVLTIFSWFRFWPKITRLVLKFFFAFSWLGICSLSFLDLLFFSDKGRHWGLYDFRESGLFAPLQSFNNTLTVPSIMLLGLAIIGAGTFLAQGPPQFLPRGYKENVWKKILRTLGPILLVTLAARGTVTAHHLELAHTEVSQNHQVNQLVMNSPWAFDKKPQDEDQKN